MAALRQTQPWLAARLPETTDGLAWTLGRDGALTARSATNGAWLGGCSLPRRAAERMLRDLEITASVACLLAPIHAAMVRAVLERLRRDQAALVIVPDDAELATLLCCDDFSDDLASHRLWLAGSELETDIERTFARHVGLPVPGQFIRAAMTSHDVEPLIQSAQRAFSRVVAGVPERLNAIHARARGVSGRIRRVCVVAPTGFRLWRDTTPPLLHAVNETADELAAIPIDTDVPTRSAPIALAEAAADADAVLSADLGRGDMPGMIDDAKPWISWVTSRRVPNRVATAPRDRLILRDPSLVPLARKAGWSPDHLQIAGWPDLDEIAPRASEPGQVGPDAGEPHLLLLADLPPTTVPPEVDEFSSHSVLWDAIQRELRGDPTALGLDPDTYLRDRARRLRIDPNQLATRRFLHHCVVSAFAIGVARLLVRAGVRLRVGGTGWEQAELPPENLLGPVRDRACFAAIVRAARALVNVAGGDGVVHPIHGCGKPVLHVHGSETATLLADAKSLLAGQTPPLPLRGRRISGPLLVQLLGD